MLINIPLQIDDAAFEGKLKEEYESQVLERIEQRLDRALMDHDDSWSHRSAKKGLDTLIMFEVEKRVSDFLNENRDAIIEAAAKDLGTRLARSKRGKEILEELPNIPSPRVINHP